MSNLFSMFVVGFCLGGAFSAAAGGSAVMAALLAGVAVLNICLAIFKHYSRRPA